MIIQVAGTNGSGKSTVVRAVMDAGSARPVEEDGRVRGYAVALPGTGPFLHVVGEYGHAATGGCDTIKSVVDIYARVAEAADQGCHVLFEGIRALNQTRGPRLVAQVRVPFVVLLLEVPLGTALRSIDARRAARGDAAFAADTRDVTNNHVRARNYAARMRDAGARVVRATRAEAPGRILAMLRGAAPA